MSTQSATFTLDGVNCAGCIAKIERYVSAREGVILARGNATARRIRLVWDSTLQSPDSLADHIRAVGYDALLFRAGDAPPAEASLLPQLGLAGFGMMNIMMISFAVWAGFATDMGTGSMQFLHWISAAIATPVVFYSGAVFYGPAVRALRRRAMTMDTPIALAILITYAASLFETWRGTQHVYFDAVTALVFFLLIGRVIERALKRRSGDAAENLRNLMQITAHRETSGGRLEAIAADLLCEGDVVVVESGERVPADGMLLSDHAQLDEGAITGETLPRDAALGDNVTAGAIIYAGPIRVRVTHVGEDAQIGKIAQMISDAATHKGRLQKRADDFARSYIPLVLGGGLLGFVIWYFVLGASFADALMIAVAVLVVTCPCAAGLATPAVASRAVNLLMSEGVVIKSGDALERLGDAESVIADKTGTLSMPLPQLQNLARDVHLAAASLAVGSSHPLARVLCEGVDVVPALGLQEVAGQGMMAANGAKLGSAQFVGVTQSVDHPALWYRAPDRTVQCISFGEVARSGLSDFRDGLVSETLALSLLSGDSEGAVSAFAAQHGIDAWSAAATPQHKFETLRDQVVAGGKPLMFGDGINDAAALKAAYVSVSFASATEVAQVAADVVLTQPDLTRLTRALSTARTAKKLIEQNLWFSAFYNIITVPLALFGVLSPLVAAVLMSASSIVVLANGLRLKVAT